MSYGAFEGGANFGDGAAATTASLEDMVQITVASFDQEHQLPKPSSHSHSLDGSSAGSVGRRKRPKQPQPPRQHQQRQQQQWPQMRVPRKRDAAAIPKSYSVSHDRPSPRLPLNQLKKQQSQFESYQQLPVEEEDGLLPPPRSKARRRAYSLPSDQSSDLEDDLDSHAGDDDASDDGEELTVVGWLQENDFLPETVETLTTFSWQDLSLLSKQDTMELVGKAEGIRLFNLLVHMVWRSPTGRGAPPTEQQLYAAWVGSKRLSLAELRERDCKESCSQQSCSRPGVWRCANPECILSICALHAQKRLLTSVVYCPDCAQVIGYMQDVVDQRCVIC